MLITVDNNLQRSSKLSRENINLIDDCKHFEVN
jgi:hypothetical protein